MNYENLYQKAKDGDSSAANELEKQATAGNSDAQYLMYCIFANVSSPYRNLESAMLWLKKSANNGNKEAIRIYNNISPKERLKYGIAESRDIETVYKEAKVIEPINFFSYYGRISRKTYAIGLGVLYSIAAAFVYRLFSTHFFDRVSFSHIISTPDEFILLFIIIILFQYLYFCLLAKRAHDCGHTCMLPVIAFALPIFTFALFNINSGGSVPVILVSIFYLLKKGKDSINKYGPVPK